MALNTSRLDKFIASQLNINRKAVRLMVAKNRILVDQHIAISADQIINLFSQICVDGRVIQDNKAIYLMLHKPVGVVSATKDDKHRTVLDLITHPNKSELHIVGRLDLNTSGLVLLTNDSRWSEALTDPERKVPKCYQVELEKPLTDEYISAFSEGMYFNYENITTLPAELIIKSPYQAEVKLKEGKYHQIKRMFGRFKNPVIGLHRSSIGDIALDLDLLVGASRALTEQEIESVNFR
jgi:16S rRNA pseudouridine516 synthase